MTPADVKKLLSHVIGFKLYPEGVTTHSGDGIPREWLLDPPDGFLAVIGAIAEGDSVLLQHGEMPGEFCLEREAKYLDFVRNISALFPTLRLTLEHISTKNGIDTIKDLYALGRPVFGTITLQHFQCTLDNVIADHGCLLNKDNHCMPPPKYPSDLDAIRTAAFEAADCFGLGSDSAPHEKTAKAEGCAGVFSAPVLPEALFEDFYEHGRLSEFDRFTSINPNKFYRLEQPDYCLTLVEKPWVVPATCGGVVPYKSHQTIKWQLLRS